MRVLAVAACALVFAAAAHGQPNVVLIVTDDQRWETLEHMPTVQTRLAGRGVTFSNAFAVNPLCCPSRASILTGTYSHTSGVWSNSGPTGGIDVFDDSWTLPVWLDQAGYQTMLVGKYIQGYRPNKVPFTMVPPGWNRWRAFYGGLGYYSYRLTDGQALQEYGTDPEDYSTDVLAAAARQFIRNTRSPFFLYFAPFAPHQSARFSVDPAPRHVDALAGVAYSPRPTVNEANVADKPPWIRRRSTYSRARLTELREEQLESLLAVDEAVAGILDALADTGELADTLIVLTSDNGYSWGEHRWAGKRLPYEESIRVPLVVRYDRLGIPARIEPRPALNVDLAPTIAAAAGLAVPGRDGRSLLPLLADPEARWRNRVLIEYHDPPFFPSYCGYRTNRWKYVQYRTGREELYDLATDPFEAVNVVTRARHVPRIMGFRTRLRASECRPPGFRPRQVCSLNGNARPNTIRGTRRRDWVCSRGGDDVVLAVGGGRDVVRCGSGRDRASVGPEDRVRSDCERIRRIS